MSAIKLKEGIYSVGVLNPNLRVFDIIMKTDYGTTYNAYIVKGKDKTALIDVSHAKYFEEFALNVEEVCSLSDIDYIIINHTEPDHSGALSQLLDKAVNATVLGSAAAGIYLKEITNRDMNFKVVKDNETLDLGGRTLKFISAPFLHWPDTMFTLVENEGVVFTCDFFGCHYCEPRMIDKFITYKEKYDDALKYYYSAIFGPFAPYVRSGLAKIDKMEFDYVCTSHGPILTKEVFPEVKAKYVEWSRERKNEKKTVEIFYVSAYGYTRRLAQEIKKGIESSLEGGVVNIYDVIEHDMGALAAKLAASDGFLVGTPTINKDMVAPITNLLSHVDPISNKGKKCGVFGSYGWSGEGIGNAVSRLKALSLCVQEDTMKCKFAPSTKDLEDAFNFGAEFGGTI